MAEHFEEGLFQTRPLHPPLNVFSQFLREAFVVNPLLDDPEVLLLVFRGVYSGDFQNSANSSGGLGSWVAGLGVQAFPHDFQFSFLDLRC